MIVDIFIDVITSKVKFIEENENETKKTKIVDLDEFLQVYTSMLREKEDKYEFLYLLPGTVEYRKNLSSLTFVVETRQYKSFLNLDNENEDFLLVIKTDLSVKKILNAKCYTTEGSFNKHFSSFQKILEINNIEIDGEDDALRKVVEFLKISDRKTQSMRLRYKDIL